MDSASDNTDRESDDVESQSSLSVGSSVSRKRVNNRQAVKPFPVGFNMSPENCALFVELYGIKPILSTSQVYHAHPRLAYERNRLELEALKLCGRTAKVWDVGSGARRHAHYNIHCLCPYLQPGDKARLNQAIQNGNSVCDHPLESWCDCADPPDYYLFVHSGYYISVECYMQAIERSTRKELLVVGHVFDEAFGALAGGEAEYRMNLRSQRPEIVMKVTGNAHVYTHPPLPWDGSTANHDGVKLDVELLIKLGDTHLWRVTLGGAYTPTPPIDWQTACVEHGHSGPVHVPGFDAVTRQSLSRNAIQEVEVDQVYGKGKFLMGETRSGRVYIPKDLVSAAARHFHGRVRDPALMLDIIHYVKRGMASSRLPERERLMSQTVIAAMAFNLNVRNEVDVTNTIVGRYAAVWKLHETLMSLTPVRVCQLTTIVVWTVIGLLAAGSYFFFSPWEPHEVGLTLFVATVLLSTMFCLSFCFKRWQSRRTADNWSSTLFHEQEVSHITGGLTSALSRTRFRAFARLREPLIPPEGQQLVQGEDPHPPKHPGVEREVITLGGIGFSTAVPTAPRTDVESEITAITHRLTVPTTVVDRHAFDRFIDLEATVESRLLKSIRIEGSHNMYLNWVNQTKFTAAQRAKFLRVYDTEVKNGMRPKRGTYFNVFAKFEKLKALTKDDLEGLKTRLINGPPDAVKVAVGPWTARLYDAVKKEWDGVKCRILYASGMTPDAVGAKLDAFAEAYGGWENMMGIWDDCSAYDSTLENELLSIRNILYPAVGFPETTMEWIHSTANKGMSKHGLKYDLGKKVLWDGSEVDLRRLFSGEMDTNLVGTIINGLAHSSGLPVDLPYLMCVCGDDNFILVPKDVEGILEIAESLRVHLTDLGLKPTQGVSPRRCDWEFCSKLLWPARDRQTGKLRTVLGPKPGRWLHRIGWSLTSPHSMNFRAAMLSSLHDVAHIPILNTYVAVGVKLSHGMRATGSEYSELKHVSKGFDMVPEALDMLNERYGLDITRVNSICAAFRLCQKLPVVLEATWIESAAKRDEE